MNDIESMDIIKKRLEAERERQAEAAKGLSSKGSFITFKNANLKVDGVQVPNNTADIRVLAAIGERAYYEGAYDPDTPQVPVCYALDDDAPHAEASNPQNDVCATCPKNKWGSAPPRPGDTKPGKGKACREGARIIVVPAGVPLKSAPMYTAKIPVTSLGAITQFSGRVQASQKLTGEFIATLSVAEDKKSFFKVGLAIKEHTPDMDMLLLLDRQVEAMQLALEPYPNLEN